jgi:hypothetical protein
MTASTELRPSVRAAFAGLIDYAGLFPPARLSLDAARREYDESRRGPHAWMLGRFIISVSSLAATSVSEVDVPLSAIVEGNLDALRSAATLRQQGARIEALEIPLRRDNDIGELASDVAVANLGDLPVFLELFRSEGWSDALAHAMETLRRSRLGAKLRCGGETAQAFPTTDEVAAFVAAATHAAVPFKATAGLHHPVRHRDAATGFTMHGFLNLLAAAALAGRVDEQTLRQIVAEEEPSAFTFDDESFAWRSQRVGIADLMAVRRDSFIAYGSCSFSEPVEDLSALGILAS